MSMSTWIKLHQDVFTHRKTFIAADLLELNPTHLVGNLARLWSWAVDNAPSGDLGDISPSIIARAAAWEGDPQAFVSALATAGFLDRDAAGLHIHDYEAYVGRLIAQRSSNAQRMREQRAAHVQRTEDARAEHVCKPEERRVEESRGEERREDTYLRADETANGDENGPSLEGHECSPEQRPNVARTWPEQRPNGDRTERGNAPPLLMVGGRDEDGERQKAVVAEAARLANLSPEQLATEAAERRARLQPLVEATE